MLALILEFANSHLLFQVLYNRSWGDPFKIDILDGPWSVTYLQQLQNFYKKKYAAHFVFYIPHPLKENDLSLTKAYESCIIFQNQKSLLTVYYLSNKDLNWALFYKKEFTSLQHLFQN